MTLVVGDLSVPMTKAREYLEPFVLNNGKYVADIGSYKLYEFEDGSGKTYGLYDHSKLASVVNGSFISIEEHNKVFEVNVMSTGHEWSRQKLTAKILMYLRSRTKVPILIGKVISDANLKNFEKLSQSPSLGVNWINTKTGDKEPFDKLQGKTSFANPTDWQLFIESLSVPTSSFYRFSQFNEETDISSDYSIWILHDYIF